MDAQVLQFALQERPMYWSWSSAALRNLPCCGRRSKNLISAQKSGGANLFPFGAREMFAIFDVRAWEFACTKSLSETVGFAVSKDERHSLESTSAWAVDKSFCNLIFGFSLSMVA